MSSTLAARGVADGGGRDRFVHQGLRVHLSERAVHALEELCEVEGVFVRVGEVEARIFVLRHAEAEKVEVALGLRCIVDDSERSKRFDSALAHGRNFDLVASARELEPLDHLRVRSGDLLAYPEERHVVHEYVVGEERAGRVRELEGEGDHLARHRGVGDARGRRLLERSLECLLREPQA